MQDGVSKKCFPLKHFTLLPLWWPISKPPSSCGISNVQEKISESNLIGSVAFGFDDQLSTLVDYDIGRLYPLHMQSVY